MPDFQLHIPQQGQQFPDFLRLSVGQLFTAQDEQVNVGKRMQLAPAIAADGHQGQIGNLPESGIDPQSLQQLVDKFGAGFNQLLCGNPLSKASPSHCWKISMWALIPLTVSSSRDQAPGFLRLAG
ncbi:Uncharacterised protein [Citrobacter koseri]|nr:Uncharacterised protein [Citrobacter koseri]